MLTGKQRRYLRSLAHHLNPVVHVGKEGVTETVVTAVGRALWDHELIKVKLGEAAVQSGERAALAAALATPTGAEIAQVMGNTVILYKPHPETPTIVLPRQAA